MLLRAMAVSQIESDAYRVFNQYNSQLSKLFSEWAGRCHLPPDALRTWKDVRVNLKLMDMSTFLQLLSTSSVIPTLLTSREAIVIYEQSAAIAVSSRARPDVDGHMLDLQHFIGALFRMSVHCFSGEWSTRYPTGEDKARMLLHVLDHSHKLFKGNFQEITRRRLALPPAPLSWSAARKEVEAAMSPGDVDTPYSSSSPTSRSLRRTSVSSVSSRPRSQSPSQTLRSEVFRPVADAVDTMFVTRRDSPLPTSSSVPSSPSRWTHSPSVRRDPFPQPPLFSQIDLLDDAGQEPEPLLPPPLNVGARRGSNASAGSLHPVPQTIQTYLPSRLSVRSTRSMTDAQSNATYGTAQAIQDRRRIRSKSPPVTPVNSVFKHVSSPLDVRTGGPAESALVTSVPVDVTGVESPATATQHPVTITRSMLQQASMLDIGSAEDVLRVLFARYCQFGDRLNVGHTARLRATQFAKFCRDAGFIQPRDHTIGHFKAVDADIVFKCMIAQQIMSEKRGQQLQKDHEAAMKVATNGGAADSGVLESSSPESSGPWKHYSFLLKHAPTSMINRGLTFVEFVQALLLVAVKKYGDVHQYSRVREVVHDAVSTPARVVPLPIPSSLSTSSQPLDASCLYRVLTDVQSGTFEAMAGEHSRCEGCHSPHRAHLNLPKPRASSLGSDVYVDDVIDRSDIAPAMALKLLLVRDGVMFACVLLDFICFWNLECDQLRDVLPYAASLNVISSVDELMLDRESKALLESTLHRIEEPSEVEPPQSQLSEIPQADGVEMAENEETHDNGCLSPSLVDDDDVVAAAASVPEPSPLQQLSELRRKIELELGGICVSGTFLTGTGSGTGTRGGVFDSAATSVPIAVPSPPPPQLPSLPASSSVGSDSVDTQSVASSPSSASKTQLRQPPPISSLAPTLAMLAKQDANKDSQRHSAVSDDVNRIAPPLVARFADAADGPSDGLGRAAEVTAGRGSAVRISRRRGSSSVSASGLNFVPPTAIPGPLDVEDGSKPVPTAGSGVQLPSFPSFASPDPRGHPEDKSTPLPALSPSMWIAAVANHNAMARKDTSSPVGSSSGGVPTPPAGDRQVPFGWSYVSSFDIDPTPDPRRVTGEFPEPTPLTTRRSGSPSPRVPRQTHTVSADASSQSSKSPSVLHTIQTFETSPTMQLPQPSSCHRAESPKRSQSRERRPSGQGSLPSSPSQSRSAGQAPSLGADARSPNRASYYSTWTGTTRLARKSQGDIHSASMHKTIAGSRISGPVAVPFSSLPRFVDRSDAPGLWPHQTQLRRFEYVDAEPKHYGHAPFGSQPVHYPRKFTEITAATHAQRSSVADALIQWPQHTGK